MNTANVPIITTPNTALVTCPCGDCGPDECDAEALAADIARIGDRPLSSFTTLEDFMAMTDPKETTVDDAPEDEQPEPANAPVEEPPPPEDDPTQPTEPVTEGDQG